MIASIISKSVARGGAIAGDLIAVAGDPTADVRVLKSVAFVMARGEVIEAPIQPLDVTGLRTVGVGTTGFLGATVYLLVFQLDWMRDTDRLWWLWTCVAGLGLGLVGWDHCRRRRNARQGTR